MTAGDDELHMTCARLATDTLSFSRAGALLKCEALDAAVPGDDRQEDRTITYLDAERARALFNWLGVQLHKGGLV